MIALALVSDWTITALVQILGFGLSAAVVALVVAFGFRWFSRRKMPLGANLLVALTVTGAWIYLEMIDSTSIVGPTPMFHYASAAYLLGVFVAATITAEAGRWISDYVACDVFEIDAIDAAGPAAQVVRSARLAVPVTIPDAIEDLEGYRPVEETEKDRLAGAEMHFPRRLDADALGERLERRIETDYDVDHAHATVRSDGTVESFAVGMQPSGLSDSLPPEIVAVAIAADPAETVSVGDPVEVWAGDADGGQLVARGIIQASSGDVTTLLVEQDDATAFDHAERYRLVTRPNTANDAQELAMHLWENDATVTTRDVEAGGPFEGEFAGWLPVRVLVIDRDGEPLVFPGANVTLQAGDTVYVLGTPEALQQLATYDPDTNRPDPGT